MFQRAELKEMAKQQLRGRWSMPVLLTLIIFLITAVANVFAFFVPFLGYFVVLLVAAPLGIGMYIYYLAFIDTTSEVDMGVAFRGFNIFGKALGIYLWTALWTFLWSLLLIIPGIIKAFAYSQSYYIIADNPNVRVTDALKISMKMTSGYKADIFLMYLSFIGWALLCSLTCGIGYLWLSPYFNTTCANMYRRLKQLSLESGACTEDDFAGYMQNPQY